MKTDKTAGGGDGWRSEGCARATHLSAVVVHIVAVPVLVRDLGSKGPSLRLLSVQLLRM